MVSVCAKKSTKVFTALFLACAKISTKVFSALGFVCAKISTTHPYPLEKRMDANKPQDGFLAG